ALELAAEKTLLGRLERETHDWSTQSGPAAWLEPLTGAVRDGDAAREFLRRIAAAVQLELAGAWVALAGLRVAGLRGAGFFAAAGFAASTVGLAAAAGLALLVVERVARGLAAAALAAGAGLGPAALV